MLAAQFAAAILALPFGDHCNYRVRGGLVELGGVRTLQPGDMARELERIEGRFDAFVEWLDRTLEGDSYDAAAAREGIELITGDIRRLIEQARAQCR